MIAGTKRRTPDGCPLTSKIGQPSEAPQGNALMECVIGLLKTESIRNTVFCEGPFKTIADVEYATAG